MSDLNALSSLLRTEQGAPHGASVSAAASGAKALTPADLARAGDTCTLYASRVLACLHACEVALQWGGTPASFVADHGDAQLLASRKKRNLRPNRPTPRTFGRKRMSRSLQM